jgi:Putative beta-barrel porin-2, OmpL-like. bbp2
MEACLTMRLPLFLGIAGLQLCAIPAASALNAPEEIPIAGDTLQISGGIDGYVYAQSGTAPKGAPGASAVGDSPYGANLANALISMQNSSGVLQFTVQLGPVDGLPVLGTAPPKASLHVYRLSPLYLGYVTIAPKGSPFTFSIGQINSLEGYEGGVDWQNANIFASSMWYISAQNDAGVMGSYTHGPFSVSVSYGDGADTRVFNFLQAAATYNNSAANALTLFYGGSVGRTGLNATTYMGLPVSDAPYLINSQMFGAYDSYTRGHLSLVPEIQYVYAPTDHQVMIDKYTSNFSAALFSDYQLGASAYALGGMVSYFDNIGGQANWYIAPRAEGIGLELTPTRQDKHLFARLSLGYVHLFNSGNPAFGSAGMDRDEVQSALEVGFLF